MLDKLCNKTIKLFSCVCMILQCSKMHTVCNYIILHYIVLDCLAQECDNFIANELQLPGPWFNIKMSSYQYRKSHCGDKTIFRASYLHNGISYTGKMASLYWIRVQGLAHSLKIYHHNKPDHERHSLCRFNTREIHNIQRHFYVFRCDTLTSLFWCMGQKVAELPE